MAFRYIYSSYWFGFPERMMCEYIDHLSSSCWCFDHQLIHPRRVFPSVYLRDSSDAYESIRVTFHHEFLKRAHLFQVTLLYCPKDPLSQVTNSPVGFLPINGVPI